MSSQNSPRPQPAPAGVPPPGRERTSASGLRGFTPQLFVLLILPLSALLLLVAFGSQSLHHEAMRNMVGDRDYKTVQAAASSLEREIAHLSSAILMIARSLDGQSRLENLILSQAEISAVFEGGIAVYGPDGSLVRASSDLLDWRAVPAQAGELLQRARANPGAPQVASGLWRSRAGQAYVLAVVSAGDGRLVLGAFSPARLIESAVGGLSGADRTTLLVIGPSGGGYEVLYRAGPLRVDEADPAHPGLREALDGQSGISYFHSGHEEHVVAYSPIPSTGWGLVIEEAWEDIASPYLVTTQSAPLVIAPVFLLALLAIWFGARRIVTPLQKLERQASRLAEGDFEAIRRPAGGIEEIRSLQATLIEMASQLDTAQQSLHGYIGAITASVENERRALARELHDDTIQALIALNQRVQLVAQNAAEEQREALSEVRELLQQAVGNLRRLIRGLRPIYLEDLGLAASLEMLAREVEQSAGISVQFALHGQERRLEPQAELAIYRMVQESLTNAVRHSGARQVGVELEYGAREWSVTVRDDGRGFAAPANPAEFAKKGHFGLLGMQERADLIGAELTIASETGRGAQITIRKAV